MSVNILVFVFGVNAERKCNTLLATLKLMNAT